MADALVFRSLPPPTTNLLARPVTRHLLPLHLLPRNGQLPPETLKLPLTQPAKPPVQFLLPPLLDLRDRLHDLARRRSHRARRKRLGREQAHVPVFVVVDVAPEGAGQRGGGRVVEVARPEAAVPEVGGGVLVRDEEDGEGGGGGGEDGVGGGRVVFVGVGGEGFGEGGHEVCMFRLDSVRLHVRRFLRDRIERERAPALDIVVSPVSERVVRADQDILPTTGQLDAGQLLLVVLLERWASLLEQGRVVFRQGFDVWTV